MKNILKILLLSLLLSSCKLTEKLWTKSYTDQVRQFLVSQDGTHVVFLSNRYHYILDDSAGLLKEILFSKYRYLLEFDSYSSGIRMFQDNNIEATLIVKVNTLTPPLDAARYFHSVGFRDSAGEELHIKLGLVGTRYKASRDLRAYSGALNRTYNIEVHEDITAFDNASMLALTPITLTADAVLILGRVVLWPLSSN